MAKSSSPEDRRRMLHEGTRSGTDPAVRKVKTLLCGRGFAVMDDEGRLDRPMRVYLAQRCRSFDEIGTCQSTSLGHRFLPTGERPIEGEVPRSGHPERVDFNDQWEELHREGILRDPHNRIRDIRLGPDGLHYLLTDQAALLRIDPAR